ncbi:MAG: hypothetical protein GF334_09175 [Candidatus Altiarchaeales archaeon]|nr:hypothetical protein [Candidatus Altiarchaeales archaeon]
MKLLIGADPEFFVYDPSINEYVSAHNLVKGTKEKPYKLKRGAVQVDGTAIEFNIAPAPTAFEFSYNVNYVLEQIREMVPEKYDFRFKPTVVFSPKAWKDIPNFNKQLGCDPDYSGFDQRPMPKPAPKPRARTRTGAGHLHLGWTENKNPFDPVHYWDSKELARELYFVFRAASKIFDSDTERRYTYGDSAAFRPKSYGMEFRSPSNAWVNYPKLWPFVFDTAKKVFEDLLEGKRATASFANEVFYPNRNNEELVKIYNKHAYNKGYPIIPPDFADDFAPFSKKTA